jgi:general L-amino acid transport system substrate-binding protein
LTPSKLAAKCRLLIVTALALCVPTAQAGPVVDRIKAEGVIRCGGAPRPGLVALSPNSHLAAGLYLDLCRAIGAALLGPDGRIEFSPYDSERAFERVRAGKDDLFFLSGSDILDQALAGKTTLGPPVVFVSTGAMVPSDSPIQALADLAGKAVCFFQGSNAHRDLEASMAVHGLDFVRLGFTEYAEIYDAYNARLCEAEVGDSGELAVARLDAAGARLQSRILPEALATFPVLASTAASDPQWSAIVTWAIYTLQRAELPAAPWTASGLDSLPVKGTDLGLADDWQKRVIGAAGTYADIYARNLGDRSRLKLLRGPNAPVEAGGLFVTPYRE